jgi:toxin ParE1/3/4
LLRLFVSADAEADLAEIDTFGVRRFGEATSATYLAGFADVFLEIRENPERGRIHAGYRKAVLRSVSYRRHRVFYDVIPDMVRIVRILHQAMDFDRHLN